MTVADTTTAHISQEVNMIETMIEAKTLASVIQNTKRYAYKMLQRHSAQ